MEHLLGAEAWFDVFVSKPRCIPHNSARLLLKGQIERASSVVQLVKVFDRLNNLACVHQRPRAKQLEYIQETERFHLPLAWRIDPVLADQMERALASLQ
jgi:(p)ppGpp synthase/HD superfamily hydrolase